MAGLEQIAAEGPTPEFAAMMAEECRVLLDALDDDSLRQVALSRMEGYNNDEIADQLGCARRTVARRLDLIRKTWLAARRWPDVGDPDDRSALADLEQAHRIHPFCEEFEGRWRDGDRASNRRIPGTRRRA